MQNNELSLPLDVTIRTPESGLSRRILRRLRQLFHKYPLAFIAATLLSVFVLIAIMAPLLTPYSPNVAADIAYIQNPSSDHWFGTDRFGRDVYTRVIFGARISLAVAFLTAGIAGAIGVPLGLASGYFGGIIDSLIMRLADTVIAVPGLLMALALVLALEPSFFTVALAIGVSAAPGYSRVVRSRVLALRSQDFVLAARAMGATDVRLLFRHILPNTLAPIIVVSSLSMGTAVLAEAALSFLGVGVRPPTTTWGGMLNDSFLLVYIAPWLAIFPGTAIFLLVLSLNVLGDGLRDGLDPRQRRGT